MNIRAKPHIYVVSCPLMKSSTMEFLLAVLAIAFCLFFFSLRKKANKQKTTKNLPPEAGGGLPLFGHLFKLSGPDPLHITLSNMADKYGSIFSIRLGNRRAVIVNSWDTAKECLRTNDLAFSNRLRTAAVGLMGYNFAMLGFSDYGPYWREMRKIAVLRLLSNRKVAALGGVREMQIQAQMRLINEQIHKVATVDMRKVFGDLTLGLMVRTVAGNVESEMDMLESEKLRQSIREFFKMMTVITISDVLPFLKWIDDYFGGMHKAFRKTGRDFDTVLQGWLEGHRQNRKTTGDQQEEDDFMTEMLNLLDSVAQEFPNYDADTMNKATCLTMIVGGTDTMSVSLVWALSLLLNNPHTLKKAQQELDIRIGRQRQVKESDIANLVYIKAIIKETVRLQPPVPVIPRRAGQDCTVAGHHISAETFLFINVWKINRDPNVWPDPLEFKPERFLTGYTEDNVDDHQVELLAFGGGRRVCPGISFAFQAMQLALASLLHGFDVETPDGEAVDMTGSFGTTNMKATPLDVCLRPRLSPELYVCHNY